MDIYKAHGTGNDFVVLPDPEGRLDLSAETVVALCDRRFGIGADGVLRLAPFDDGHVFMDYRNGGDGAPVEMCGNGVRVVARHLVDHGWTTDTELRIGTRAGVRTATVLPNGDVTVDMGPPSFGPESLPFTGGDERDGWHHLDVDGTDVALLPVSVGNPHAVLLCDDPADAPVTTLGPRIETDDRFPKGTNVEFVAVRGGAHQRARGARQLGYRTELTLQIRDQPGDSVVGGRQQFAGIAPRWRDCPERRAVDVLRILGHGLAENAHGADAVDQRVMHLDVDGETVVLQPFDDVAFPRRPGEIQRMAVQAGDQHTQLAFAAGPGQGGQTEVEIDVDILVVVPEMRQALESRRAQAPVPWRIEALLGAEVRHHFLEEVRWGAFRQFEDHQTADVHRGVLRLHVEPRCVEWAELLTGHAGLLHRYFVDQHTRGAGEGTASTGCGSQEAECSSHCLQQRPACASAICFACIKPDRPERPRNRV